MKLFRLYRYYGVNDVLLYVGMISNFPKRNQVHACSSIWFEACVKVTLEHCNSQNEMELMEKIVIGNENPLHNVMHRKTPDGKLYSTRKREEYQPTKKHLYVAKILNKSGSHKETALKTKMSIQTLVNLSELKKRPNTGTIEKLYIHFKEGEL